MPDESTPPANTPPVGDGGTAKEVARLSADLAKAQQSVETANARIKELEGQVGGLTTANKQANEQATTFKQQAEAAQKQIDQFTGEVTNWKTQHEQAVTQRSQVETDLNRTKQELALFQTIASKAEYHPLVGLVQSIKVGSTPEEQTAILDALANGMKAQGTQLLQQFQAGGTPATGTGVNSSQNQGPAGPKTVQEAHALYQQAAGVPGREAEAALAWEIIMNPPNPNGGGSS